MIAAQTTSGGSDTCYHSDGSDINSGLIRHLARPLVFPSGFLLRDRSVFIICRVTRQMLGR